MVVTGLLGSVESQAEMTLGSAFHSRYERGLGEFDARNASGALWSLGYRRSTWQVFAERFAYSVIQNNRPIRLRMDHEEWMFWSRARFLGSDRFSPFAGVGAGFYQQTVQLNYGRSAARGQGREEFLAGAGLGLEYRVFANMLVDVEGRGIYDQPRRDWALSVLARLTFAF